MLCKGVSLTSEGDKEPPKNDEQDGDCTRKARCGSIVVGEEGMTPEEGSPQKSGQSSEDGKKAQESREVEEVARRSDD